MKLEEDKARIKRDKAKGAITLALSSLWEEAIALNREIIDEFPRDVEAYNRLGKALSELGSYEEAKNAFRQTLAISPANSIARKNLQRLEQLSMTTATPKQSLKATPQIFIEERGKSASISLRNLPADLAHLRMAPGDAVEFRMSEHGLVVESPEGQYIGEVDHKLGSRLVKLIKGGNRYDAAVTSVQEQNLIITVKEIYQHRSQYGVVSFPNKQPMEGLYSYLEAPQLPADIDLEDEEIEIERSPIIDWDEDGEATIAAPPSDDELIASRDEIEEQSNF